MAVQCPAQAAPPTSVFLALKFALPVCVVFWCPVHGAQLGGGAQTGGKFIQIK